MRRGDARRRLMWDLETLHTLNNSAAPTNVRERELKMQSTALLLHMLAIRGLDDALIEKMRQRPIEADELCIVFVETLKAF
jgi:hypothetical protein